jgi:hypothetical protein
MMMTLEVSGNMYSQNNQTAAASSREFKASQSNSLMSSLASGRLFDMDAAEEEDESCSSDFSSTDYLSNKKKSNVMIQNFSVIKTFFCCFYHFVGGVIFFIPNKKISNG